MRVSHRLTSPRDALPWFDGYSAIFEGDSVSVEVVHYSLDGRRLGPGAKLIYRRSKEGAGVQRAQVHALGSTTLGDYGTQ